MPEETTVAVEQPVALPDDYAEFLAVRSGKTVEKPVEQVAEQPVSEAPADEQEAKSEPESDPEAKQEEQPRDEHGKFKPKEDDELPRGVQKRIQKEIDKAVKARKEAEELLRQAREESAKRGTDPAPKPEPTAATTSEAPEPPNIDDFDDVKVWSKAMAKWAVDQATANAKAEAEKLTKSELEARDKRAAEAQAAQEQKAIQETWSARVDAARQQHADFDEVLDDAQLPDTPAIRALQQAMYESEQGAELLYHLAHHPEEATRLAKLTPTAAIRELGKIEAGLTKPQPKPAPKTTPVSAAPPPIKTVAPKAAAAPVRDPEKMSFEEYREWRKRGGK